MSYVGVDVIFAKILLMTMSIFCKMFNINVNSTAAFSKLIFSFFILTTLTKDADQSTATVNIPLPFHYSSHDCVFVESA